MNVVRMSSEQDQVLPAVYRIVRASPREWPHVFEDLRRRQRLFDTVRHLNRLLAEPAHRELAQSALKRLGLYHSG